MGIEMQNYLTKLTCGFYFQLLDIDEQLIYKRIGTAVAAGKECLEIRGGNTRVFRKVCTALRYDNPEFFYWDSDGSSLSGEVVTLKYRLNDEKEVLDIKTELRKMRTEIEEVCFCGREDSIEKQLECLHGYLVNHVRYAYEELQKPECTKWIYDIEGCLLKKRAVCLGIAQTVNYICSGLNISSLIITGQANLLGDRVNHAWNLVKIGDTYWHMDVTSEICGEKKKDEKQFLFRNQEMSERFWKKEIYPVGD